MGQVQITQEIPKYRKKAKKTGVPRANHKHEYANCVFRQPGMRFDNAHGIVRDGYCYSVGLYCSMCGKILSVSDPKWFINERGYLGLTARWNDAALREFSDATRTLPLFTLGEDFCPKQIPQYEDQRSDCV